MEKIILAIIGSGLLTTLFNFLLTRFSKKSNVEKAVMQLLGMNIRERCEAALERNSISSEELRQIKDMNRLYKEMGGNGYVHSLMKKIDLLDTKGD